MFVALGNSEWMGWLLLAEGDMTLCYLDHEKLCHNALCVLRVLSYFVPVELWWRHLICGINYQIRKEDIAETYNSVNILFSVLSCAQTDLFLSCCRELCPELTLLWFGWWCIVITMRTDATVRFSKSTTCIISIQRTLTNRQVIHQQNIQANNTETDNKSSSVALESKVADRSQLHFYHVCYIHLPFMITVVYLC